MKSSNQNLIWRILANFPQRFTAMFFALMVVCSQPLFAHPNVITEVDSAGVQISDQQPEIPNVTAYNTVIYVTNGAQIISKDDKSSTAEISAVKKEKVKFPQPVTKKKQPKNLLTKKKFKNYKSAPAATKYSSPSSNSDNIRSQEGSLIIVLRPHSPLLYHPELIQVQFLQPKFLKEIFISYQQAIFSLATYFSFWVRPPPLFV